MNPQKELLWGLWVGIPAAQEPPQHANLHRVSAHPALRNLESISGLCLRRCRGLETWVYKEGIRDPLQKLHLHGAFML